MRRKQVSVATARIIFGDADADTVPFISDSIPRFLPLVDASLFLSRRKGNETKDVPRCAPNRSLEIRDPSIIDRTKRRDETS